MHNLESHILVIEAILTAQPQIADVLGEEWPDFHSELWKILNKLDKANDDEIDELVTDLLDLGLQTPAASIFRRILNEYKDYGGLQEVSRSIGQSTSSSETSFSTIAPEQLRAEIQRITRLAQNIEKHIVTIIGSGAIAQGSGAIAIGEKGIYVQGNIYGSIQTGDVRYLNAGFLTTAGVYAAPDTPLALDQGPYHLAVNIGTFWGPGTAVSPFPPLPDDLYDENDTLTLDVIARTQDTGLQINSPQQTLTLPRAGDSPAVLFDLAIGQPGRFTIDVDVFYHGHLLQSRRTEFKAVALAGEIIPPSAWPVQDGYITFTRTAHLTREALAPLAAAPRRLTILAERDASWQNIGLRIYDNSGESLALRPSTFTDASLTPLLNGLRRRLLTTMDDYSGFIGGSESLLANHLGQLAEAGYAFYRSLLPDLAGAANPATGGTLSRTALRPGDVIQIAPLSAQVSVPWELVYERPIHTQNITLCSTFRTHGPAATDCPHHNDPYVVCPHAFWGYRYIIEQLPCRVERHAPLPGQSLPLFVRNGRPLHLTAVTYDTGQQFSKHWQNLRRLAEEPQLHLEQITSWAEADTFFTHRETAVNLLYFYTHGGKNDLGQPYLQISDGSKITLNDLEAWQATWRQDAPLVIMNACESADYTPDDFESLILFFSQRGAAGVIGTQCPVKELLADAFILPFFAHFLRQMPAGEALFAARRQLLYDHLDPRGLVYSLFAAAEVKLAQPVLEPER